MSVRVVHDLQIEAGFATQKGRRPDNQDYVALCVGSGGDGAFRASSPPSRTALAVIREDARLLKLQSAPSSTATMRSRRLWASLAPPPARSKRRTAGSPPSRSRPGFGRHGDDVQRADPVAPNGLFFMLATRASTDSPDGLERLTKDHTLVAATLRMCSVALSVSRMRSCLTKGCIVSISMIDFCCVRTAFMACCQTRASCAARRKGRAAGNVGEDLQAALETAAMTMSLRLSSTSSMCRPPTSAPCRAPSKPCDLRVAGDRRFCRRFSN